MPLRGTSLTDVAYPSSNINFLFSNGLFPAVFNYVLIFSSRKKERERKKKGRREGRNDRRERGGKKRGGEEEKRQEKRGEGRRKAQL